MRIGMVTGEYPPMEGGVGAFTEQLAMALAILGHEIHIITSVKARPDDSPKSLSSVGKPVELDYGLVHTRIGRWRWPSLSAVADLAVRYDLELVNLQYQAAAFNMHSAAISYLPWRLKGILPSVVTFHDLRVPYLFPKAGRLRGQALIGLARRAHGCIATNATDARRLQEWTESPVRQIPIGSNIEAYEPNHIEIAEVRDRFGLGNRDILLGYFGFLNDTKGADTLIDALARLDKQYHLVFIGGQTGASDPENNQSFLERLRKHIESAGLTQQVHWTGYLAPSRVSAHLAAADMMVMPYRDGVSLRRGTLMAVLAHGRPLITTQPAGSEPEFRHGENMWLVPIGDPDAIVSAVKTLIADDALRQRLGKEARELAQSFGWDVIARQTADFYAKISGSYRR